VFGGTNDSGHGDVMMGDINSNDNYTFNGALNNLIIQLKNDYPNSKIIFMTPLHRKYEDICMNGTGYILKDYVQAIINATKRHNVYLIDLFNEIDLNPHDIVLVPDGLHPSDKGHEILAEFVAKKLLEI
jgi:lysophospholipase L1-like esterase